MNGLGQKQFQGVHMNDITIVKDLLTLNKMLYNIDFVDAHLIGDFVRQSV